MQGAIGGSGSGSNSQITEKEEDKSLTDDDQEKRAKSKELFANSKHNQDFSDQYIFPKH